jgi:hypothetical protein
VSDFGVKKRHPWRGTNRLSLALGIIAFAIGFGLSASDLRQTQVPDMAEMARVKRQYDEDVAQWRQRCPKEAQEWDDIEQGKEDGLSWKDLSRAPVSCQLPAIHREDFSQLTRDQTVIEVVSQSIFPALKAGGVAWASIWILGSTAIVVVRAIK